MIIYLIRHGDWFEKPLRLALFGHYPKNIDSGLTRIGKFQAELVATWLMDKNIQTIFTSHHLRTQQTTKIINDKLKKRVKVVNDLQEIRKSSKEKEWHNWSYYVKHRYEDQDYKVDDGESINHLITRSNRTIKMIARGQHKDNILIVTHAEFIKCLLGSFGLKEFLTNKEVIPNASVTTIVYDNLNFQLLRAGQNSYLWCLKPILLLRKLLFKILGSQTVTS